MFILVLAPHTSACAHAHTHTRTHTHTHNTHSPRGGHSDDTRGTPATVRAFQRRAHHLRVARTIESVVHPPLCHRDTGKQSKWNKSLDADMHAHTYTRISKKRRLTKTDKQRARDGAVRRKAGTKGGREAGGGQSRRHVLLDGDVKCGGIDAVGGAHRACGGEFLRVRIYSDNAPCA